MRDKEILRDSLEDLAGDFGELGWIAGGTRSRAETAMTELHEAEPSLERGVFRAQRDDLLRVGRKASMLRDSALTLREIARSVHPSVSAVDHLAQEKRAHAETIRSLQSYAAAAITCSDWQSPSFEHSVAPQAGRFIDRITEHVDDYRRDRHADAAAFEAAYLEQFVEHHPGERLRALMTSCGMSAFATVLAYLLMEMRPSSVVVGRGLYHECKQLVLRSPLGAGAVEVDEDDVRSMLAVVDAVRPQVILLDALCNEKAMALPDLTALVAHLSTRSEPVTVVLDITGLSWTIQPFPFIAAHDSPVRLLVVESLTKYLQFGLDRTPAGMIVAPCDVGAELDRYREHLGTNVSDVAPYLIPPPCRDALDRRLARIGRNAQVLAEALNGGGEIIRGARYPGLPGHSAHARARCLMFRGGYFAMMFAPEADCVETHRRFVRAVIDEARARGVAVVAGASFGFDITRIYRTSDDDDHAEPFVRIAAGTEHRLALERLSGVLKSAVEQVDRASWSVRRLQCMSDA